MSPGYSGVKGDSKESAVCDEPGHRPIVLQVVNSVMEAHILYKKEAARRTGRGQNWKVWFCGTILRL